MSKQNSKEFLEKMLGDKYPDILEILNQKTINYEQTTKFFNEISLKAPKDAKMLLSYRKLVEQSFDETYPESPMYLDFYTETEEDVEAFTKNIKLQWEQHKKRGFSKSKNVIYDDRDYFQEILEAPKHPVIGDSSLCEFLERAKYRIEKSNGNEAPELEDLTFIQPMFCEDKNGNIIRLIRVVELLPCKKNIFKKDIQKNIEIPTFNFSISYKIMPDNNLNHSTCLVRIDSDKSFHKDLHFHFFDRDSRFAYLGKPLSAKPVTLNDIVGLSKQGENQKRLPFHLQNISALKTDIKNLAATLLLAEKKLKGEKAFDRKQAWLTQLFAVKMSLNLLDKAFETTLEQNIDDLQQKIYGAYYEVEEERKPAKAPRPKPILSNRPINEVRGKGRGKEKERKELLKQKRLQQELSKGFAT